MLQENWQEKEPLRTINRQKDSGDGAHRELWGEEKRRGQIQGVMGITSRGREEDIRLAGELWEVPLPSEKQSQDKSGRKQPGSQSQT